MYSSLIPRPEEEEAGNEAMYVAAIVKCFDFRPDPAMFDGDTASLESSGASGWPMELWTLSEN